MNLPVEVMAQLRLPRLSQLGIVVEDLPTAVTRLQSMGVAPWYGPASPAGTGDNWVERNGKRIDTRFDIAVAYSGDVQLELIEPRGPDATVYSEHLEQHGEGLHHLGFCVRDLSRRLASSNIPVLQRGVLCGKATTRYAYLDTTAAAGIIVELIEVKAGPITLNLAERWMKAGLWSGDTVRYNN